MRRASGLDRLDVPHASVSLELSGREDFTCNTVSLLYLDKLIVRTYSILLSWPVELQSVD